MEKTRITRIDYLVTGKFDITNPSFLSFLKNSEFVDRGKYFLWRSKKDHTTLKVMRNGSFFAIGLNPKKIVNMLPIKYSSVKASITYLRLPFALDIGKTLDNLVKRQSEGLMHFSFYYSHGELFVKTKGEKSATIIFGQSTARMYFSKGNVQDYIGFVNNFIRYYGHMKHMMPKKDYLYPNKNQYEIWKKPKRYVFDYKRLYN